MLDWLLRDIDCTESIISLSEYNVSLHIRLPCIDYYIDNEMRGKQHAIFVILTINQHNQPAIATDLVEMGDLDAELAHADDRACLLALLRALLGLALVLVHDRNARQ